MSSIVPYLFEGEGLVRAVMMGQVPWFVATDVCKVLGIRDTSDAVARLDDDEKGTGITGTPGGTQEVLIVNESGLYALIFRSRKPAAQRFRKWVTSVVLPSIRKTGSYGVRRRKTPTLAMIARGMKEGSILIRQLKAEADPAVRKFIYSGLVQTLDVINVEVPLQDELLAAPDGQELAKQLQGVFRTVPDEDQD